MNTHKRNEIKRKEDETRERLTNQEKIDKAKQEIKNLGVILAAIPDDKTAARMLIVEQIGQLRRSLPKHTGRIWWHWLIEWCPKCEYNASQAPFCEDLGEDCALFQKIDEYHADQEDGTTEYKCACGTPLIMRYRHASQDRTDEQNAEALAYSDKRSNENDI